MPNKRELIPRPLHRRVMDHGEGLPFCDTLTRLVDHATKPCRWKVWAERLGSTSYKTRCRNIFRHYEPINGLDIEYCPYCGKRIEHGSE